VARAAGARRGISPPVPRCTAARKRARSGAAGGARVAGAVGARRGEAPRRATEAEEGWAEKGIS
jgi:hypothetical protein